MATLNHLKLSVNKLWLLVISCCAVGAYVNSLPNQFVWDDNSFIVDWSKIEGYSFLDLISGKQANFTTQVYRPVRNLLYIVSYYFWGHNPLGYRIQAILIHLSISLLVYLVWKKITKDHVASGVAGLLFSVHPIHTEAITWTTASFDIWAVLWLMLAIYWYFDPCKQKFSLIAAGLAFFSYEIALMLPVMLIIIDKITTKKRNLIELVWQNRQTYLWYFIVLAGYGFLRLWFIGSPNAMDSLYNHPWQRLWLPILLLGNYTGLFLWPFDLTINRHLLNTIPGLFYIEGYTRLDQIVSNFFSPQWAVYALIAGLYAVVTGYFYQKQSKLALGLIWFGIFLLPVLQLVAQPILFAEKYLYVASVGGCWFVGSVMSLLLAKKLRWLQLACLCTIVLLIMTWSITIFRRNQDWYSSETLWKKTLQQWPTSPAALNGLGGTYVLESNYTLAIPLLEQALAKIPNRLIYQRNLVTAYENTQQYHKAIPIYLNIVSVYPDAINIWYKLYWSYLQLGNTLEAKRALERVLSLDPNFPLAQQKYQELL